MKKLSYVMILGLALAMIAFKPVADTSVADKLVSKNVHISFYSHTVAEDITAHNYKVVSTLDPATGEVVFSIPMQSFEFEKALMQKHFNSYDFLDTKTFPKAKFTGTITNLHAINFTKEGTYNANVEGELTIKGVTKPVKEEGTITVNGNHIKVQTKMKVMLSDYDITFTKGKPSTNVAKEVEATVNAEYLSE